MSQISSSNFSETAASNNAAPPNGAPEGMTAADINNVIRELMSAIKIEYNRSHGIYVAGGTANALTLTYPTSPGNVYILGMEFAFYTAGADNTAAATLNVNGIGTVAIVRRDGSTALSAGDLVAGSLYKVTYDGTSFRLWQTGI